MKHMDVQVVVVEPLNTIIGLIVLSASIYFVYKQYKMEVEDKMQSELKDDKGH